MVLIAIYNPVCGNHSAKSFFFERVFPLLTSHSIQVDNVFETEYPGHAGRIVSDLLHRRNGEDTELQVILGSGDGTLHEVVNEVCSTREADQDVGKGQQPTLKFVLIPCGTANALYSSLFPPPAHCHLVDHTYKLQSLHSYLRSSHTVSLSIAAANLFSSASPDVQTTKVWSAIVTSTCMHASILLDSDVLRQEHPGMERFKIAAQNNSERWYRGRARLFPPPGSKAVQMFEPGLKRFVDFCHSDENMAATLEGPFIYFLSVTNVDRLEPLYIVTPIMKSIPPVEGSCDVIIVRPLRNPALKTDDLEHRKAFSPQLWEILTAPYKEGAHIYMRYTEAGSITMDGEGPSVVEYFRCGGWEWLPVSFVFYIPPPYLTCVTLKKDKTDNRAHFVCSDGAIYQIENGGRASSSVIPSGNGIALAVYA
ncbi:hypothetical protein AX17_004383 [Amanita inopinata Kibby_2008]|nr:hypothetical protein AX17_004383 [Amanita inopinata Kibby_2008]